MKAKTTVLAATLLASLTAAPVLGASPSSTGDSGKQEKVLRLPMRTSGPGSLDPITGSTVYDNRACGNVYETLLQYKYFKRPYELEPLLLAAMPTTEDGLTWRFELKQGVRFHDDDCFPGGKGRELVTDDVFYSFKRLADKQFGYKSWWVLKEAIVGLDAFKEEQANKDVCDYSAPVAGFRKIDDHNFTITLTKPVYRFLWTLAMFQLSIVPREAVEMYGTRFARHPVGTGPFLLKEGDWIENKSLVLTKNPNYHPCAFPTEWMPEDEELGLTDGAGKMLPLVDRVEITMFVQENPMWLEFNAGSLDYTQVPAENQLEAFHKRSRKLKKAYRERGIQDHKVLLLDFIFRGFNMEDELLGGYTDEKRKLRQAIALAVDLYEFDESFYNSTNIIYDGMIPPGMEGYPPDGKGPVSWIGPDLERAKKLLAEAGYPEGKGLPAIDYYVSNSGNISEQAELLKRQLGKLGVNLNVRSLNFAQLIDNINRKKAPLFSYAWSSDYPDAEGNLALFYGPNEAPGSNAFNYKNPAFDELYEKIVAMQPSPERTKIAEQMRDMVLKDAPFIGSMARTRFYIVHPWMKNFKPDETFYNWIKYMDVDESLRQP